MLWPIYIILLLVVVDQAIKVYIKTNFHLDESVDVFGDWFKLYFVENNGAAFGLELGGNIGKYILTGFRLFVTVIGFLYLKSCVAKGAKKVLIIALCLILAGAIGNIIDSVFYGVIFNTPAHNTATLFAEKPYGELFYGKVVDMFYFPIWEGVLPEWIPFVGGDFFRFFNYIFNPADSYITIGVILLFLYSKAAFPKENLASEK